MALKALNKEIKLPSRKEKNKVKVERSRDVVSFDIGSNTIKIVEGRYSRNKLQIYRLMELETPEGAIEDGKITNQRDIYEGIKNFIKDNNIRIKDGTCTTNSSAIINREIVVSALVNEDEIDTVIEYEIEQYLPIKLKDYVIQYTILDKVADNEGAKNRVNVVSYPNVVAKGYYDLLYSLDINPYVLDVSYNSLNKLSNHCKLTNRGTVAFVDMGATSINVTIFKDNKLDFTRIIKYGGNNIDYALSTKIDMSIKSTESERIEKSNLINVDYDDVLNIAVQETLDEILGELERILQFYNNQSVGRRIENIMIFGGLSNTKGIDKYMEKKLNISTQKVTELNNIEFTNQCEKGLDIGKYLNAIGALIRI